MHPKSNYILTCIGPKITPPFYEKLTSLLRKKKIVLHKIKRIAHREIDCVALSLATETSLYPYSLTKTFSSLRKTFGVDLVVQASDMYALKKRLVVMDLDSTLIQAEVIDELAKEAGVGKEVALITRRAMNGEIAFPDALRKRVGLLKGLPAQTLYKVYTRLPLTEGAIKLISTLRKRKCKTAVLTGGFDYFALRVQKRLKLNYAFSNQLEIKKSRLTGKILGEIIDGPRKAFLMEKIAKAEGIGLNQVVAIGDGANDLPMIIKAGLGIAFNAKPAVRSAAPYSITQKSLTCILHLFGISESDI